VFFFGFADPDRSTATLEPVVEQDAGDLPSFARAGAVAQEPVAPKTTAFTASSRAGPTTSKVASNRPLGAKTVERSHS
jgi:hypothetical protein